ncbi:hypothetical protein [Holophaga foetida]|uniref:hypothetical protein n=1 Tax=Holophaga foetida TaxID=35839 RepID=UPI0002473761|nr:hypothetical protein [Holophaga foetida]
MSLSSSGPAGALQSRFEDGLRLLAAALALRAGCSPAPAITAACDALRCFLAILEAGAERHLPDPGGEVAHLRNQCQALLTERQDPAEVMEHALDAAKLARDQAARILPRLL